MDPTQIVIGAVAVSLLAALVFGWSRKSRRRHAGGAETTSAEAPARNDAREAHREPAATIPQQEIVTTPGADAVGAARASTEGGFPNVQDRAAAAPATASAVAAAATSSDSRGVEDEADDLSIDVDVPEVAKTGALPTPLIPAPLDEAARRTPPDGLPALDPSAFGDEGAIPSEIVRSEPKKPDAKAIVREIPSTKPEIKAATPITPPSSSRTPAAPPSSSRAPLAPRTSPSRPGMPAVAPKVSPSRPGMPAVAPKSAPSQPGMSAVAKPSPSRPEMPAVAPKSAPSQPGMSAVAKPSPSRPGMPAVTPKPSPSRPGMPAVPSATPSRPKIQAVTAKASPSKPDMKATPAVAPKDDPAATAPRDAFDALDQLEVPVIKPEVAVEKPVSAPKIAAAPSPTAELEKSDPRHQSARRFARVAVGEIKLYHENEVLDGRKAKDLWKRLGSKIDLCIQTYETRVPSDVRERFDYLYDELVRQLAEGDPSKLGADAPTFTSPKR